MWLEQAKLHAISGNMPWATLSLIYSCLSKLLRLQGYRSFPFKSDIIVTEYFLWALKFCSWSRKCVTATESKIYGWILKISKQCRHPTCKYKWSISLRHSADGLLHTFALTHLQHSTPAGSKSHQVHLQVLPLHQTCWCWYPWEDAPSSPTIPISGGWFIPYIVLSFPGTVEKETDSSVQKISLITF